MTVNPWTKVKDQAMWYIDKKLSRQREKQVEKTWNETMIGVSKGEQ